MRTRIRATSKDYVGAPITEETGIDVTADVVELSFTVGDQEPTVWTPGVWKTVRGRPWAVALIGPGSSLGALPPGRYWINVRVTDNPEVPVLTSPNTITIY